MDGILEGMDDLILQFRGSEAGDLFVAGYFNARRIGGNGSATSPAPSAPTPPPNP